MLLCGEGPHDIGQPNCWDARTNAYVVLDGWMQPIVRSAVNAEPEFSVRRRVELQVQPRNLKRRRLPPGHGAKAYLAKRAAFTGRYDVVIYMVDADSNDTRQWQRIVAEIEAGFLALEANVLCIACVPMAASERWLLSDPNAWAVVAGYDGAGLPARPEAIWGARHDPASNHPHRLFFRICDAAGVPDDRETRALIAEAMSLQTARVRCPISVKPFLAALQVGKGS